MRYRLTSQKDYPTGSPVTIGFTLENRSSEPLWVLKWSTPLEGIWGAIFEVTRDGKEIPYQGPLSKRGDPSREDYVRIAPGESASAELDLAQAWDFSAPGTYRVEFVGHLHDVAPEGETLPRPRDAHRSMDLAGEALTFRVTRP